MTVDPILTEDPDVAEAIEAFRPAVVEIRARSARLIAPQVTADQRDAEQAAIDDLVADVGTRAERLGIAIDELFRLINADLAGRDGDPSRPHGVLLQELLAENGRAYAAERLAWREVEAARARLEAAIGARLAADRACAGYVAGWAVRA